MPENHKPRINKWRVVEWKNNSANPICRHNIVGSCPYCREVSENE
jgi:hypothetical protein